jgi:spore maturation protein CgeB
MKIVVFGLTISSSWGNGHATLWRGLVRSLARRGWTIVFFERDVSYYAGARDYWHIDGGELVLYPEWEDVAGLARRHLADADVAMVTSYCPDGLVATDEVLASHALTVFYDLDTPVTLARLGRGEPTGYIGPRGLADFDLVLSYTGGKAIEELRSRLGARMVLPFYGHVDPDAHRPSSPRDYYAADLSYIGTYAADRQAALEELMLRPAMARPGLRFVIAGAQYPQDFPWSGNIYFVRHLPPGEHAAFYSSSRLTLNLTRRAMAQMGWCPSGRLFEAAACGTPILSDSWPGLDEFFAPGQEILIARDGRDTLDALGLDDSQRRRIARAARERVLAQHTSDRRGAELEGMLEAVRRPAALSA